MICEFCLDTAHTDCIATLVPLGKHHHPPWGSVWGDLFSHLSNLSAEEEALTARSWSLDFIQSLLLLILCLLSSPDGFISAPNQTVMSNTQDICNGQNVSIKTCEFKKGCYVPACPWAVSVWLGQSVLSARSRVKFAGKIQLQKLHTWKMPAQCHVHSHNETPAQG